jgi:hypothetical protein
MGFNSVFKGLKWFVKEQGVRIQTAVIGFKMESSHVNMVINVLVHKRPEILLAKQLLSVVLFLLPAVDSVLGTGCIKQLAKQ